ncbi:MAG TPA: calcium/sodium antiporter [Actinomycetes bacterium]|nr:calcium/sodium antiporter [Actinomycetes bacterium]
MIQLLVGFGVGLLLLAKASDYFVVGSARLATRLRVSPVFIGVAVIGFGTSAPELLVSGLAAAQGSTELAVGNVVGSNAANMTLVLGIAGLMAVVPVRSAVLRWEAPLSVGAVLAFAALVPGGLSLAEGAVLLGLLAAALWLLLRAALAGKVDVLAGEVGEYVDGTIQHSLRAELIRTGIGLVGTLAGAQLLVWGAAGLASRLGVPPEVIGFTLVAVGTSLPELVTAIQAQRHNEPDLLVGNLLGSNLFNSLAVGAVIGLAGAGARAPVVPTTQVVVMVVTSLGAWLLLANQARLDRWEAGLLLAGYAISLPLIVLQ